MLLEQQEQLLADHTDMRVVPLNADEAPADRNRIVQLSPDHPGFRDVALPRAPQPDRSACAPAINPARKFRKRLTRPKSMKSGARSGRRWGRRTWPMPALST